MTQCLQYKQLKLRELEVGKTSFFGGKKSVEVDYKEFLLLEETEYRNMINTLHDAESDQTSQADNCTAGISLPFTTKSRGFLKWRTFSAEKNHVLFFLSAKHRAKNAGLTIHIFLDP